MVTSMRFFLLATFLFATVCSGHLWGQGIALDASSLSTGGTDVTDDCWAHTVGTGSDRLLIVGVSVQEVLDSVNSVTWYSTATNCSGSSQTLTQAGSVANGSSADSEMWRLINPTAGTGSINVNFAESKKTRSGAVSFFNVDQTTPLGTFTSANGNDTTPTVTVTGVAEGEVVVDVLAAKGGVTLTVDSSQVERWNGVVSGEISTGGSTEPGPDGGGSVTMSWSLSSIEWAIGAVALKPVNATAIKLTSFTVSAYADGVALQWQTGYEVDNLGFHVYREEGGQRLRLTPDLVAGSALLVGARTRLKAGYSYRWWDPEGGLRARYWLEEIDLNGSRTWHGPASPEPVPAGQEWNDFGMRLARSQAHQQHSAPLLSRLGPRRSGRNVSFKRGPLGTPEALTHGGERRQRQRELAALPAVRLKIRERGWYEVTQPELEAAGLSRGVHPDFLQLYVEGGEQPMVVSGSEDGRLDPWDSIGFYGLGQDTPWSETRTYWLVEGVQPGRRVEVAARLGPYRTPERGRSFPFQVERRERTFYFAALKNGEKENFFGPLVAAEPVEQMLEVHHLSRRPVAARLEVVLQGVTAGRHQVKVLLNGRQVGQAAYKGQQRKVTTVAVPEGWLREGENVVTLEPQGAELDISMLEVIRLSYGHTYQADGDALEFTTPGYERRFSKLSSHTARSVTVGGFGNPTISVLDITDPQEIKLLEGVVRRQGSGYAVKVWVRGLAGRTFLAFTPAQIKSPVSIEANQPSAWHDEENEADLVIMAHGDFLESLEPLKALREAQGYTVAVVDIADVYDEFGFGVKTPWALRDFLVWASSQWQTSPRFVLLVGDASFDPRNYLGLGDFDFVPTRLVETAVLETASDDWFVDFDGDALVEMAVGRLPVRTLEEATQVVSKIVSYEQGSRNQPWSRRVLLVADEKDGFDFAAAAAELETLVPADFSVRKILLGQADPGPARTKLLADLNQGQLIVNYLGHGSVQMWKDNLLTTADAGSLTNGLQAPLVVAMTCLNGFFHDLYTESIGEAFLKADQGGAIAVWASSGLTTPSAQAFMNYELFRQLFNGEGMSLGEAIVRAKASVRSVDVRRTWIFFGDPTTSFQKN